MGTFTMPLKKVIELTGGTTEIVGGISKMTGGNIGLHYYPIFDEGYRETLTGKIIDRYWNREIGLETISMFQLAMRRKMNEIMPLYNKLYLSEKIEYTALSTVALKTTTTANANQSTASTGSSDSNGVASSESRSVNSETPQTMLSGNGDYATAASDVKSGSDNSSTANQTTSDTAASDTTAENNTTGYQGAASDLVVRYRESLLNIDLMVLSDLEECFMLVWDNSDSYTNNGVESIPSTQMPALVTVKTVQSLYPYTDNIDDLIPSTDYPGYYS